MMIIQDNYRSTDVARELIRKELALIFHDGDCGCGAGDNAELAPYYHIVDILLNSSKIRTCSESKYLDAVEEWRDAPVRENDRESLILEITPDK